MKKFTTKDLALSSIIGALYVALVFAFFFISFSDIQFRIAEVLLILVIFNPKLAFGIIVGTFVANTFAPGSFGIIDGAFGTLATMVGLIGLIAFRKKPIIGLDTITVIKYATIQIIIPIMTIFLKLFLLPLSYLEIYVNTTLLIGPAIIPIILPSTVAV